MAHAECLESASDRRRCFWTTQPCGCGSTEDVCGRDCCDPGMAFKPKEKPKVDPPGQCPPWDLCSNPWGINCATTDDANTESGQIATNDWVRGLIINMLNTDKRRDPTRCGTSPADIRGHWSESFIDGESGLYGNAQRGYRVGTGLRYIETGKYRIREIEALIQAELVTTLQKLVQLGIAQDIAVEVTYAGNNTFNASLSAYGPDGAPMGRVAIIGQRDEEAGFFWSC